MTEAQKKRFYFPAWGRCAEAMDWRMEKGRLIVTLAGQRTEISGWPGPAREAGLSVLDYAAAAAAEGRRRVTAEDLRHGCNLVATGGRESSSERLTNKEVNRVAVLFRLLREPEDLDAVIEWLHPENADKRSLLSYLRKLAGEDVLVAIARNAFGTSLIEGLEEQQLRWMLKQVKGRPKGEPRTLNGDRGQDARGTAGEDQRRSAETPLREGGDPF